MNHRVSDREEHPEMTYQCWDDCGRDEDEAVPIDAHGPEQAARQYGEAENSYTDFEDRRVVFVKGPDNRTRDFTVEAEM